MHTQGWTVSGAPPCLLAGLQRGKLTVKLTLHQRREQVWPFDSLSSERCRTAHSWANQGRAFLLRRAFQIISSLQIRRHAQARNLN